ncbi:hypothetical protein EG829_02445 [bacterium]|nr:hypothetical protein [bacterium]
MVFICLSLLAALCLSPTYAMAQDSHPTKPDNSNCPPTPVSAIGDDELAVLAAVLKERASARPSGFAEKTVTEQLDDRTVAFLRAPGELKQSGMPLDDVIIRDFNDKNARPHALPRNLVAQAAGAFGNADAHRTLAVSRAGFDVKRARAVVFLRDTYVHPPEVFIQEEFFLMLERSGDSWNVIKKITAGLKHS